MTRRPSVRRRAACSIAWKNWPFASKGFSGYAHAASVSTRGVLVRFGSHQDDHNLILRISVRDDDDEEPSLEPARQATTRSWARAPRSRNLPRMADQTCRSD